MAYALSFAEAFFLGDGSVPLEEMAPSRHPCSVYEAILSLPEPRWAALARDVFHVEPEHLDPETVLQKVIETDTCANLDAPVEVWIDDVGDHTLLVYE